MYVPQQRRAVILRLLEQRGYVHSADLAAELGVTDETIRTDLRSMQEDGLLRRVHGGARYVLPRGGAKDATRLDCQFIERILPHISPGMRVYLDAASLSHTLLSSLGTLPCTILTPSLQLLGLLSAKALPQQAIAPEGRLDKESGLISAELAETYFQRHAPDLVIVFPGAIPSPDSIAYAHAEQAKWAAAAVHAGAEVILPAAAGAFGAELPYPVSCTPSLIISEDNLPAQFSHIPAELVPYLSADVLLQISEL